ncbi:uncharacterized protein PG986_014723 [Apiospora aurea]|uniref:Heterokaryon incompatibility domain-containing protein n=1 Tax=Apiospora aurea TaxID=335848 RepID=A0ABR1PUC5_9PEZI
MTSAEYVYTAIPRGEYIGLLELSPGEPPDVISVSLQVAPLRNCAPYTALSYVWGTSNTSMNIICNGAPLTIQKISNDLEWFGLVEYADPEGLSQLSAIERELWENLSRVFSSPWFTRVWVIQEAGLATDATVLCGTRTIPWQQLADVAGCIDDRASAFAEHFDMTEGLQRCVDLYWLFSPSGRRRSLVETLGEARCFNTTNMLDKVYALLSHPSAFTTSGALLMDPDYGLSQDEMSARIAMSVLRECNSLQLLSAVHHNDAQGVDTDPLPSFAPRWHEPPAANMLWAGIRGRTFKASLVHPARYRIFEPQRSLVVTGIQFDIVSDIGPQMDRHMWRGEDPERRGLVECLAGLLASHEDVTSVRYPPGQRRTEAFVMTMTCGMFMGEMADFEAYARRCGFRPAHSPASQPVLSESPRRQDVAGEEARFIDAGGIWSPYRKPFVTRQGHIGLGPKAVDQGDIVCVLFGCMVPFILRKGSGSRYRLVGECYVPGITKGEVIEAWETGELTEEEFTIH